LQPKRTIARKQNKLTHLQFLAGVLAALALASLLRQKVLVDVGQNTALGNGDVSQQLVQLLIVADGELEMAGDNTGLLVIASSVAGKFENFSSEVLENGGKVDGGAGTDTLSIVALAKKTVNTADRKCQTSLGGTRLGVLGARGLATRLATTGHFD